LTATQPGVFVLIHGGGHGGWCWRPVAQRLRSQGFEVYTPTLTGFGDRSHVDAEEVTFETFVEDITGLLFFEDLHDVVLVGHSMGGVIVPRVAEAVPERIRAAVWLTAVVTADGESLWESVPQSPWVANAVTRAADGTATTDPELILDANIHDGTPAQRDFVRQRHRPYPPHALTEPGRLSAFLELGIPTGYVIASDDRTIEPHVAARFADLLPGVIRREVPGGHDCMLTEPDAVAAVLSDLAGSMSSITNRRP
jgi:pimeloyl-ACP methyl ester carboxylesterase